MSTSVFPKADWRHFLPQGDAFVFVEAVLGFRAGEAGERTIRTCYTVPDCYLRDHFGVFPGVLQEEMANQSLIILSGLLGLLKQDVVPVLVASRWEFQQPVLAGQTLMCELACSSFSVHDWRKGVSATATLFVHEGQAVRQVARGSLTGKGLPRAVYQRFMKKLSI